MIIKPLALILCMILTTNSFAARERSSTVKAEFKRINPCPSTGQLRGSCPGYIMDHINPLCAGGPDDPSNMQWQTVADAKIKDRSERTLCRTIK